MITKFGLQIPSFTLPSVPDDELFEKIAGAASAAERSGFDSVWVMDHLFQIEMVGKFDEPMFEAYTLLGALAARTSKVSLGAMVTGVTYRNPALLAKQVTTLDVLSGGRAILGIGAAWYEGEHVGLGFRFPPLSERFDRLEEALQICKAMFTESSPSFQGRYYQINNAVNRPGPLDPAGIPILIGGGGERRTLRLVAKYADVCNVFGDAETVARKMAVLEKHCVDLERDPAQITKTRLGTLVIAETEAEAQAAAVAACEKSGVDPVQFRAMATIGDPDSVVSQLAALFETGLDGLIFNMPDPYDDQIVELAGKTLVEAFGGLTAD